VNRLPDKIMIARSALVALFLAAAIAVPARAQDSLDVTFRYIPGLTGLDADRRECLPPGHVQQLGAELQAGRSR
jgi:hypothetical protein